MQDLYGSQEDSNTLFLQGSKRSRTAMSFKKSNTERNKMNESSMIGVPKDSQDNSSKEDTGSHLHQISDGNQEDLSGREIPTPN